MIIFAGELLIKNSKVNNNDNKTTTITKTINPLNKYNKFISEQMF